MTIKLTAKDKIKVLYPSDVYAIMKRILLRENKIDRNKEHLWVIGLNSHSTVLFIELVSLGTTTTAPVEPMQVFRVAVHKGASAVMLVHNHPSGVLEPSKADKDITDRLLQAGKILDIQVIDHLIISEKAHYSFSKSGLLAELERHGKYIPSYLEEKRLRDEAEAIGKQKGKREEKKAIAKILKEQGLSIEAIKTATGLKESEINKL